MADNNKKKHKQSSGKRKSRVASFLARRATMKIKRWKRYQEEITNNKRRGSVNRWNTAGLERHVQLLEKMI